MKKIKFNVVDLLILLIVIVIMIFGYKLIKSSDNQLNKQEGDVKQISYNVLSSANLVDSTKMPKIGDKVYDSVTQQYIGEISNISVDSHSGYLYSQNLGAYVKEELPDTYDMKITISGNGYETDTDVIVENQTIKVGKLINVKSKGYVFVTYVIEINE